MQAAHGTIRPLWTPGSIAQIVPPAPTECGVAAAAGAPSYLYFRESRILRIAQTVRLEGNLPKALVRVFRASLCCSAAGGAS